MKITIISTFFPYPRRGHYYGSERYIENLAIHLKKLGHEIKIVTTYWNGGNRHDNYKGIPILRVYDSRALIGNFGSKIFLDYITFGLNLYRNKNFKFYKDSDIIILKNAIPFTRFFKIKRIPLIYVFFHLKPSGYLNSYERNLFKQHKNIIAISNPSKTALMKAFGLKGKNIKVIPIGIDEKRFIPSNRSKKIKEKYGNNILLYSGLMLLRKRIPILLKAMTYVIKEIPDTHLILTGSGPFLNDYKNLAKSLGIQKNTTFLGFLGDKELVKYYASSDIFVLPSVLEGFGQVLLEAMASGTPVICTNKPPMSEIIGDGGLTFEEDDSEDLAQKIIYLLRNRDILARLKQNALKKAMTYKWSEIAKFYNNYLKNILKLQY
ncbi:MAG: glycosyltransferase family 4 protein [Promethearchaeota archaeon]